MFTYDGQTTDKRQTASNENPTKIHVKDDDVDLEIVPGERNKDDGKVLLEQNTANIERHHGGKSPEEKIMLEENRERRKGRKLKEEDGIN
jgi:hypothetical protein